MRVWTRRLAQAFLQGEQMQSDRQKSDDHEVQVFLLHLNLARQPQSAHFMHCCDASAKTGAAARSKNLILYPVLLSPLARCVCPMDSERRPSRREEIACTDLLAGNALPRV